MRGVLGSIRHHKNVEKIILNRRKNLIETKTAFKTVKTDKFSYPINQNPNRSDAVSDNKLVTIVAHWGFAVTRDQWRRMIAAQIEKKPHRIPNRTTISDFYGLKTENQMLKSANRNEHQNRSFFGTTENPNALLLHMLKLFLLS